MKRIFLVWKRYCARSHNLANHFDAKIVPISPFSSDGKVIKTLLRYFISFIQTVVVLNRERADIIFSLNQPPPLILAIYLYTRLFGGKYVLDSHSAPFNNPILAWLRPFYRYFACKALFNINTNAHHKHLIESWGGRSYIISDVPIDFGQDYPKKQVQEKSIAVVVSFMFDEPIKEIWEAARRLPDVSFYVTGNYHKCSNLLLKKIPDNIRLQGFLPRDDYLGLLISVKGVMSLTTRDYTMQMGAYEALSLAQPIITSHWEILRTSFGDAAVYVNNTPESIAGGIRELFQNYDKYSNAAARQKRTRREHFDAVRRSILAEIDSL
jgi:hypothetical protein